MIGMKEIIEFKKKYYEKFGKLLEDIERLVNEGKENHDIPIYATKRRRKKEGSILLKLRRFYQEDNKIEDFTDHAGFRILCLFEKDIVTVNQYLVGRLLQDSYIIHQIKIYNWFEEDNSPCSYTHFLNDIHSCCSATKNVTINGEVSEKESGYKSVHYIVESTKYNLIAEIQLRTLFQDVWGELEHAISYKKMDSHAHIKKSFSFLAKELEIKDHMISHLRDIKEKESERERQILQKMGPKGYMIPEFNILHDLIKDFPMISRPYEFYRDSVAPKKRIDSGLTGWVDEAVEKYNTLVEALDEHILKSTASSEEMKGKAIYLKDIEGAYLSFARGKYKEALDTYEQSQWNDYSYVIHFRMAELYLILGEEKKAMEELDTCEQKIINCEDNPLNLFRVKLLMAYSFWLFDEGFIDISIDRIEEAYEIYVKENSGETPVPGNNHINEFNAEDYYQIINYRCWYKLMKYIIIRDKIALKTNKFIIDSKGFIIAPRTNKPQEDPEELFQEAKEMFDDLKVNIEKHRDNIPNNLYDTAAWFCYNEYLKKREKNPLGKKKKGNEEQLLHLAKEYAEQLEKSNYDAPHNLLNLQLHEQHIQTIEKEYDKVFGGKCVR